MGAAMAKFRIFLDSENYLAITGFPEGRRDEEIRVASISEMEKDHTHFVLCSGYRVEVNLSFGEIISKFHVGRGVDFEGTQYAPRS
jgi:hypothetical protein